MRQCQAAALGAIFSVELELAIDRLSADRQQRLDQLSNQLVGLFERHQLPATWAVADPARSAATTAIVASRQPHEVAILGECSWLGRGAGRLRIERELSRRVGGARQAGIDVTTLVLRNVADPLDLDVLLQHRITGLSYCSAASPLADRPAGPHFGIWHAPAAWRLPVAACWWQPLAWQASRRLRQALRAARTFHVAIDGDTLVDQGDGGLAQIAVVLEAAGKLRSEGKLSVHTIRQIAGTNLALRSPQPAKSALCPAA